MRGFDILLGVVCVALAGFVLYNVVYFVLLAWVRGDKLTLFITSICGLVGVIYLFLIWPEGKSRWAFLLTIPAWWAGMVAARWWLPPRSRQRS